MQLAATLDLNDLAEWAKQKQRELANPDFTQPLKVCLIILRSAALDCFNYSRGPDGTPWLPLKRPRANSKGKDKPLQDTGLLYASVGTLGKSHVERIEGGNTAYFGSADDRAAVHQFGAVIQVPEKRRVPPEKPYVFPNPEGGRPIFTYRIKAHTVTIPPRPFIGIGEETANEIREVFSEFLTEQVS